ncbi:type IV pilus assembly protein PilM [Patescibacteria group bacterium]|nr:type IV pilus assembly protein PilM [Patescibacteria group bacterium]
MFNFLSPKINSFGIDLSDLSIKIACLKKHGGNFYLASFGRQEIREGLIVNGEIKKEDELIGLIKEAVKKVKGRPLKTKYCVASLPETVSFVQVIKMPLMDAKELSEAVKWELEAHIPLSKDEIYYDWQIIDDGAKIQKDHLDILIGVLPKKTVDPYLSVLKKAGLKPLSFEIEPIATVRALIKNGYSDSPIIIIDMGAKRTGLLILFRQAIYFTTAFSIICGSSLVDALSQDLNIDQAKALQIKMKVGLNIKHPASRIYKTLSIPLLDMAKKIKNYIEFYNEHLRSLHGDNRSIVKIIFCGGGAKLSGLTEFFSQELAMPIEIGNPWINIYANPAEEIPEFNHNESSSFTTALGLALRNND